MSRVNEGIGLRFRPVKKSWLMNVPQMHISSPPIIRSKERNEGVGDNPSNPVLLGVGAGLVVLMACVNKIVNGFLRTDVVWTVTIFQIYFMDCIQREEQRKYGDSYLLGLGYLFHIVVVLFLFLFVIIFDIFVVRVYVVSSFPLKSGSEKYDMRTFMPFFSGTILHDAVTEFLFQLLKYRTVPMIPLVAMLGSVMNLIGNFVKHNDELRIYSVVSWAGPAFHPRFKECVMKRRMIYEIIMYIFVIDMCICASVKLYPEFVIWLFA